VVTLVLQYSLIELVNAMTRIQKQDFIIYHSILAVPSSWKDSSASYYPVLNRIIAIR